MILLVVYVGAVAVLFLFVVMMLDVDFAELKQGALQYAPVGAFVGIVLAAGAGAVASETAASLGGYMTMWVTCAVGGFLAALLLLFVPRGAFTDSGLPAATPVSEPAEP